MRKIHIIYGAEDGIFSLRGGVGTIAQNFITSFKKIETEFELKLSVFTIKPKKYLPGIDLFFAKNVKKICESTGGDLIYVNSLRKKIDPYFDWKTWDNYNKSLSKKIKKIIHDDEFNLVIANDVIFGNLKILKDNVAFLWIPHSLSSVHQQSYLDNLRRTKWERQIFNNINKKKNSYVGYLSEYTKNLLIKDIRADKLVYTPNGFNFDFIKKYVKSQNYIKNYLRKRGVPINKKLVVSFGRADEYKGLDVAFKRMVTYTKKGYSGVLIASKFSEEKTVYETQEKIKNLAKKHRGSDIKLFFGYEFLLPKYLIQYKNTKILLHLPTKDYCPLIPLETYLLNPKIKIINSNIACNGDFSKRKRNLEIEKNYTKAIKCIIDKSIERSAGAIIKNSKEILVIKRKDGFYGLPKGHVKKGESFEKTAIREVGEETGLYIKITKKIGTIYRSNKDIHIFKGVVIGGRLKKNAVFVPLNLLKNKMKHRSDLKITRKED